ncbi:glycosyltransferase family 4 protein [Solicola sp. PLA-1-18]|uniref:glycosyltransferase family 4 protein n=1 Tax=Solicola sp. PLA-1-18 TaxID=3380532 RepID=UPI003B783F71
MSRPDVRLAVVADAVEPFHTGGKEARYAALLPRVAGHGVTVQVHTMRWWDGEPPTVPGLTFRALGRRWDLYAGARRSIWQAVAFAGSTVRMLTRRFDVLEADAIPFLPLFPLRLVTWARRARFVVTWHEVWGREYWRSYLGPLGVVAAALEKLAASLPDHIVAASEGTAERLRDLGVAADRITVVPNGVDQAEIDAAPVSDTVGDLLCVGRLLAHKNVHVLLDAVAILHERGRPVTLTVIGTGPENERLQQQVARLGLTGHVEVLEPLDERRHLLAAMKGARVLAFPSEREGFGMVALEALACGTPVVTSDHPDNHARHLVADGVNGAISPVDPAALADALGRTLDHAESYREGARATARDYSWDALASTLAKVVVP